MTFEQVPFLFTLEIAVFDIGNSMFRIIFASVRR